MSHAKSRAALALLLVVVGASPSFAWRMNGPEWLQMMEKVRADKADSGSPRGEWQNVYIPARAHPVSHGAVVSPTSRRGR